MRLLLAIALVCLSACQQERAADAAAATPTKPPAVAVLAASSLTEAFQALERDFEADNPGLDVRTTFAGSQVLRLQIEQGAGAHVFASANAEHVGALARAGRVRERRIFAHSELALIVPRDNPAGVEAFEDLPRARRLVIGTAGVPAGIYTRELFRYARERLGRDFVAQVRGRVVSEENNVRLVRAKVELGEADAAFVYRTDALGRDGLRMVPIPDALDVRVDYHAGLLDDGNAGAARFYAYLASPAAHAVLTRHGFTVLQ